MDSPNEYELAIEIYAKAVREETAAAIALEQAKHLHESLRLTTQECWREVRGYINERKIQPGIYRVNGPNYAEGLVIGGEDYPRLMPMFRK